LPPNIGQNYAQEAANGVINFRATNDKRPCIGLLELNSLILGRAHKLGSGSLQHLGVRGIRDCLVLHGGVHDHSSQARLGDELQSDRHIDRLLRKRAGKSS